MKENIILIGPEKDEEFPIKSLDGSWSFFFENNGVLKPMRIDGSIPTFQNEVQATKWIMKDPATV